MKLEIHNDKQLGNALLVCPSGKLDAATAPALWDQVCARITDDRPSLLFNFENLSQLTSAGIGILVRLNSRITPRGGTLAIAGCSPAVRKVIRIVMLEEILNVADSLDEARQLIKVEH